MNEKQEECLNTFLAWRDDVDQDHDLDVYDLALGWFSGKNFSHDEALLFASFALAAHKR